MIGKLKRSLKERCPLCGKVLQIRVMERKAIQKGEEVIVQEEYICCSNVNCDYEREKEKKRVRRKDDAF